MAPGSGEAHLLLQDCHVGGAATEAGEDADLHGHAPAAGLDQRRLVEIALETLHRIGVVLHDQVVDQFAQGPELPVLQPVVVGEAEGAGREADHRAPWAAHLLHGGPQFPQQGGELLAAPLHPVAVVEVGGRLPAGVSEIKGAGVGVIAQFHRPGEVVVELDAIDPAALHDLLDQTDEAGPHPRVGRIQPHPQVLERGGFQVGAMHGVEGTAVGAAQHPLRVPLDHFGIARLHQAVLEPGDHLHAAPMGGLGEAADRVEARVGLGKGRLHRSPAAAVEGGPPAPDIGVEGVEAGGIELRHGGLDATGVVVEGAGAVGEPDADAALNPLGQAALGVNRLGGAHCQGQQGRDQHGERHRQMALEMGEALQGDPLDGRWGGGHGNGPQRNIELTELSWWIRQIVSPSMLATDSTRSWGKWRSGASGMLLVTTTSSNRPGVDSRSKAGGEKTAWVAQASTRAAPRARSSWAP